MFKQYIIVFAGQCHIGIIIPRNKSMMAHGTEHGACYDIICQSMLLTYPVYSFEYAQDDLLYFFCLLKIAALDLFGCHIVFLLFVLSFLRITLPPTSL